MSKFEEHANNTEKAPESSPNPELRRLILELKLKKAVEDALEADRQA